MNRSEGLLASVAFVQIGLLGAFVWWFSVAEASPGPSVRSVAELCAPLVVVAAVGGPGWVLQRSHLPNVRGPVRVIVRGLEYSILGVLAFLVVLTPIVVFVELVFEGIG